MSHCFGWYLLTIFVFKWHKKRWTIFCRATNVSTSFFLLFFAYSVTPEVTEMSTCFSVVVGLAHIRPMFHIDKHVHDRELTYTQMTFYDVCHHKHTSFTIFIHAFVYIQSHTIEFFFSVIHSQLQSNEFIVRKSSSCSAADKRQVNFVESATLF